MLRAVGFSDEDFVKPIIGVANGYSTITPCNSGIQPLAERAISALQESGTMPQVFGTITISDGISMGTEGMKYSLVSREVIADSIETVCNGQSLDGVLAIGGCDKNMPGAMIALARLDIPSIFVYGGTIKAGHLDGEDLTVVSSFEAVGQHAHTDTLRKSRQYLFGIIKPAGAEGKTRKTNHRIPSPICEPMIPGNDCFLVFVPFYNKLVCRQHKLPQCFILRLVLQ